MIFLSIDRARVLLHGRMKDQRRLSQSRLKMLIDSLRISGFSGNRLKSFRGAVSCAGPLAGLSGIFRQEIVQ